MIFESNKVNITLQKLYERGIVPNNFLFDITEEILIEYIRTYSSLSPNGNKEFDFFFARRLAGMNLMKLKFHLGASYKTCKEGFVYCIKNRAWPEYIKVGMSVDINKRVASLQTGDPHRAYKIDTYEFSLDRRKTEKQVLENFKLQLDEDGEWINAGSSVDIIRYIRRNQEVLHNQLNGLNYSLKNLG